MPLLCKSATTWVTKEIIEPVEQWVDKQEQKCKKYPWWDPRGWFCWFVTVTVKVTVWVTKKIVVPIIQVTCTVVSGFIFLLVAPFAAAIDALFQTSYYDAVKAALATRSKITFVSKVPSGIGAFDYYNFNCECGDHSNHAITVSASNDDEAAKKARIECAKACA